MPRQCRCPANSLLARRWSNGRWCPRNNGLWCPGSNGLLCPGRYCDLCVPGGTIAISRSVEPKATPPEHVKWNQLIPAGSHHARCRVLRGVRAFGSLRTSLGPGDAQAMYLDALSDLVASYEDERHSIEPASDADMLRHLMDAKGVTQIQLSRDTGLSKSTISEVLAGKKPFSRKIIHTLANYFHVDIGVLAANL